MPRDTAAGNDIPGGILQDDCASHVISHGVSRDLLWIHVHTHAISRRGVPRDPAGCVGGVPLPYRAYRLPVPRLSDMESFREQRDSITVRRSRRGRWP